MVSQRIQSILEWLKSQPHQSLGEQIKYEWGGLRIFSLRESNEAILKGDAIARRKRSPGCRDKSAKFLAFQTVVLWVSLTMCASIRADWIVLDGERHEDVLITAGATLYYVSFPKTGVTVSVNKSEVPESEVQIDTLPERRKVLFEEWSAANEKLKAEREARKKAKESQVEAERMEKKRLDALAAEELKEQERIAELEKERNRREKLGKSAEALLAKESEKFASKLKLVDRAETEILETELHSVERQLRVEYVRAIANPSRDPKGEGSSELVSKISEIKQAKRERVKLRDRAADEPGYPIATRRAVTVKTLVDKGWDETEAEASVEEMEGSDMLPDPPANRISENDSRPLPYTLSVRETASVMTLVDCGWNQADAVTAIAHMSVRETLMDMKVTPSKKIATGAGRVPVSELGDLLASRPTVVPISDITFDEIWTAFFNLERSYKLTSAQKMAKLKSVKLYLIGLRVSWRGWVSDANSETGLTVNMDHPYNKNNDPQSPLSIQSNSEYSPIGEVSFVVDQDDVLRFDKDMEIGFEGTIASFLEVGGGVYVKLKDVDHIAK